MTTWHRHRTTVDSITAQLVGVGSLATAGTINGHVRLCSDPTMVATLPGTVVSAADAVVSLALGSWLPTAELGSWDLTWHPEFQSGARPVLPEGAPDTIVVHA